MKKLNKKGFTLVELLAVIAILSILLIIAIPGVLNLFNRGKKNAFVTQAQSIYKIAEENYVADQLGTGAVGKYCAIYTDGELDPVTAGWEYLDMGGAAGVSYYIEFTSGKVTEFYISNNEFSLGKADANGVTLNDLDEGLIDTTFKPVTVCGTTPTVVTP